MENQNLAIDDPSILPDAPPPRPTARESAVEAAMRRFDGEKAPVPKAISPPPRRAWASQPHYGMALAASLALVIGVPAALIGIRDFEEPRPSVSERAAPTPTESIAQADSMGEGDAATVQSEPEPQEAAAISSPAQPEQNPFRVLPDDEAKDVQPVAATRPSALAPAASAAPSAPPPPPAVAEAMDADEISNVVVTGSRAQSQPADRGSVSRSEKSAADRAMSRSGTAPDWVLRDRSYADFLAGLQSAVRSGDRLRVVGFVRFPLRVNHAGGAKTYRDAAAVLADYDSIFTSSVTNAILGQQFETLFGRDQGVMIGSGQVWFDYVCRNRSCDPPGPVRITAINP